MTLGKLIERFENTLLPRTNKQIVWVPCDINRPRVYCCPGQYGGGGPNSSLTHTTYPHRSRETAVRYKNQNTKQVNRMDRHKGIYISLIILHIDLARAKSEAFI